MERIGRIVVAAAGLSCLAVGSARAQTATPRAAAIAAVEPKVRDVLTQALLKTATRDGVAIRLADTRVLRWQSRAIRGAVFHLAQNDAEDPTHHVVTAASVTIGDTTTLLDGPWPATDVARLRTDVDAVAACVDLVQLRSSLRDVDWPPVLADSNGRIIIGRDAVMALATAEPPSVNRPDSNLHVVAWFAERGRATRYRCSFAPGAASLAELRVVRGIGLPHRGS